MLYCSDIGMYIYYGQPAGNKTSELLHCYSNPFAKDCHLAIYSILYKDIPKYLCTVR